MKTDQFPIEVKGQTYYVQRTFNNQPGIYVYHNGVWRHCESVEGKDAGAPMIVGPDEGDVMIIASLEGE